MSESGNLFSRSSAMNRKQFWTWIACLVAAKVAVVFLLILSPALRFLSPVDTVIVLFIAFAIGARFRDTGWPSWVGVALTLLIMLVLPIVLLFAVVIPNGGAHSSAQSPLDAIPWYVGWSSTTCMIVLVIVAGTRPSREPQDHQPIAPPVT